MNQQVPRTSEQTSRNLMRALSNAGITVYYQPADMTIDWAQNVPDAWAGGHVVGLKETDFLSADAAEIVADHKQRVLSSGVPQAIEFRDGGPAGSRWYEMWVDADKKDDGSIVGLVTTVVDITERKHREQTLRALLREVSHRSKNLLAIIQSVATQTGRYSSTIETFLDRFRGRLQSLASTQDLVTSSNWRGATLRELVDSQIDRFLGGNGRTVQFSGDDVHLNPNAALHIGLALHELVVNSISHGALSMPAGTISLQSEILHSADGDRELVLTWEEMTGADEPTGERRFGSIALERVVPLSLDGDATLKLEEGRLAYRLVVPAANFEVE